MLRGTHLGTRLFLAQNPLIQAVREQAVPAIVSIPPVRRRILAAVSQLTIGYRGSFLSVDADSRDEARGWLRRDTRGLRAGDRVVDGMLIDSRDSRSVALFDLISRGWTLLIFPGDEATPETTGALERIARQVHDTVGDVVDSYCVLETPARNGGAVTTLVDPGREISRVFAAGKGLVALVRPDGYLGYRGRLDQHGELASYLARVFAMRLREEDIGAVPSANPGGDPVVPEVP